MSRKKILIFIDHDLIVRHFLKSGAFKDIQSAYDVKYVFNIDNSTEKKWIFSDIYDLGLENVREINIPRARMGSWHKLFATSVLRNQRGTKNYKPRKELMATISGKWHTRYYQVLSLPVIYQVFRHYFLKKQGIYKPLENLLKEEKPDLVIHPTILAGYLVNELPFICKELGLPLVYLMNSWDNPSVKALGTSKPNKLVVWGRQTKEHAIEYMKMPREDVLRFGAAQFQVYRDPVVENEIELRKMFKVPEGLPIVLYGGASKGAHESKYLKLLDELIEKEEIPRCHVIYRPHPWRGELGEGEVDFFDLNCRHITMDPFMEPYYRKVTTVGQIGIEMADYAVTRKVLELASAVISPLSTILLESVVLGKPVLMFYPESDMGKEEGLHTRLAMNMVHFSDFWGVDGINVCKEEKFFKDQCSRLLEQSNDQRVKNGLQNHAKKFLELDGPTYSQRVKALVEEMTKN